MTLYESILQWSETKGKLKGKLEGKLEGIIKSLKRGRLTISEIAEDFDVSVEYVLQNKAENGL